MNNALSFFESHPTLSWIALSAFANLLIDVFGKRDTKLGLFARRIGTDLRGVIGKGPKAPMALLVAFVLFTQEACSWFKSDAGATTITTPYGSVQHKGPYVPDPAPTTNVYVWCGVDAGVSLEASVITDAH